MEVKNNNVSIEDAERIRSEISSEVIRILGEDSDVYKDNKLLETIACYYLWILKKDPLISVDGMFEKVELRKINHFSMMIFDDFTNMFKIENPNWRQNPTANNIYLENKEAWEEFKSLADLYTEDELVAAICKAEYIEADISEAYYAYAPKEIGRLADKLMGAKKDKSILHIGSSSYAMDTLERKPQTKLTVYEENDYSILTLISIFADVLGYHEVICSSGMQEDEIFDNVFVNERLDPSEGAKFSDGEYDLHQEWPEFPCGISPDWDLCGIGLLRTKESGRVVAVMNSGQLTLNKYRAVREFLCKGGYVEGVILLPDKMYNNTWINPYLLILSRNNKKVKFLDAREEYIASRIKGKRINTLDDDIIASIASRYEKGENCVKVSLKELEGGGFVLTPNRYQEAEKETIRIRLGDMISDIKRGITLSAAEMDQMISDSPSTVRCLLPADITAGVVTSERYFHGNVRKPGKNEAWYGAILISKTGNPFSIAVVDKVYLVVGNVYILRLDTDKCCPEYVQCFLSSEAGQKEIMKYATGAMTPIISVANLGNIEIPVYDETKQKELNEHAREIVSVLRDSYKQIKSCKDDVESLFR